MMRRDEALRILARHVADEIVVAVYQACFDWMAIAPRDLNYVSTGAMGQGAAHALGLALGRPDKRVLVFDGDGSLLMNLGGLVTVAAAAPRNYLHFVFENGTYEANGGHPIPGAGTVDFCAMALAAGYRAAHAFAELGAFEAAAAEILASDGPALVTLRVVPGAPAPRDYARIHGTEVRAAFRRALRSCAPCP